MHSILRLKRNTFGLTRRQWRVLSLLTLVMVLVGAGISNAAQSSSGNLLSIAQQEFEVSNTGWVPQGNTTISQEVFAGQEGTGALLIRVDPKGPWPDSSRKARVGTPQYSNGISASPNTKYSALVHVRGFDGSAGKARCEIREYNDYKIIATHTSAAFTDVGPQWSTLNCFATTTSNAKQLALRIFIADADNGEKFLADNASLTKTGTATVPTTTAQTATTQPAATNPTVVTSPATVPQVTQPPTTQPPATLTGTFIRKVDVGPQSSSFGHKPAGTLKKWTKGSEINNSSAQRDSDGWMRLKGYEFEGPLRIVASRVELSDCAVKLKTNGKNSPGTIFSSSSNVPTDLVVDHCLIDQGMSGWSLGGIVVYGKFTVRRSLIIGSGDGIKVARGSLIEDNYIEVNGQGTETSPGHIDGIHGEYFKYDWTARHNTIIGGIGQAPNGGSYRPEAGGNFGIWAPTTATGSIGRSGAEGVLMENNYIDGFNVGIGIMGTNRNNPNIARNNTLGANFRYYPNILIRTWDFGRGWETEGTKKVILENNVANAIFEDSTGTVKPYKGSFMQLPNFNGVQ